MIKEQKYLCAYCCSKISVDKSHNEHIEPRHFPDGRHSDKTLDYENLIASCNGYKVNSGTCGPHKENIYSYEKFVSPLNPECEDVFSYYPNGEMVGDDYTISLLNLNSFELRQAREAVYKTIFNWDRELIEQVFLNEDREELEPFTNVVKWYLKQK